MKYERTTSRVEKFKARFRRRWVRKVKEAVKRETVWPELLIPGRRCRTWAESK